MLLEPSNLQTQSDTFSSSYTITYLNAGVDGTGPPGPPWVAEQDVLGFEVSVKDAFALQDFHGLSDLLQEYADGVFT